MGPLATVVGLPRRMFEKPGRERQIKAVEECAVIEHSMPPDAEALPEIFLSDGIAPLPSSTVRTRSLVPCRDTGNPAATSAPMSGSSIAAWIRSTAGTPAGCGVTTDHITHPGPRITVAPPLGRRRIATPAASQPATSTSSSTRLDDPTTTTGRVAIQVRTTASPRTPS